MLSHELLSRKSRCDKLIRFICTSQFLWLKPKLLCFNGKEPESFLDIFTKENQLIFPTCCFSNFKMFMQDSTKHFLVLMDAYCDIFLVSSHVIISPFPFVFVNVTFSYSNSAVAAVFPSIMLYLIIGQF